MAEHTEGPWRAWGTRVYFPDRAGGFDIRNCPNAEANAVLIAAAPDMLAALCLVDGFAKYEEARGDADLWTDDFREIFEVCRAAIAKATATPERTG